MYQGGSQPEPVRKVECHQRRHDTHLWSMLLVWLQAGHVSSWQVPFLAEMGVKSDLKGSIKRIPLDSVAPAWH